MAGCLLSSCLTRRNALSGHSRVILTDASAAAKNLPANSQIAANYAEVLGVDAGSLTNLPLYAFINNWMGTPYRLGGTDSNGLDCSAFTSILFREIYGLNLPRTAREMAEIVQHKKERQLQEGDLLFFAFESRSIDHVGVYLQNHKFVHVSTSRGVIISDLNDAWYHTYLKDAGSVL
ncbi:lipoprotein Spr [bacterium A37T11]|nr:lipoprotein Spr [bacterium A37T11]